MLHYPSIVHIATRASAGLFEDPRSFDFLPISPVALKPEETQAGVGLHQILFALKELEVGGKVMVVLGTMSVIISLDRMALCCEILGDTERGEDKVRCPALVRGQCARILKACCRGSIRSGRPGSAAYWKG